MNRSIGILVLLAAAPGLLGIVVDGSEPQRYESPPRDDPGWRNVGQRGATSAVYLGRGWVVTARHSAMGEVRLGDHVHRPVTDSMVWLDDPSGAKADLVLFRIEPEPRLPRLRLQRSTPPPGSPALMVGYGAGRGEPREWSGFRGFRFSPGGIQRWGSNSVSHGHLDVSGPFDTLTRCFLLEFDPNGVHEAQAATGDSGGAVFVRGPEGWSLAGVMLSVSRLPGQTPELALFGNFTNAADLSVYADQILETIGAPAEGR